MSLKNFIILQKQQPKMLCKKGTLKNFAIFTGKHLCWSLFASIQGFNFIKVARVVNLKLVFTV